MTFTQLEFQADQDQSQNDLILRRLQADFGRWVPMPTLSHCSGSLNVHSRISDLKARSKRHHLDWWIEQKNEREGRIIHSFYRLVGTTSTSSPSTPPTPKLPENDSP